MAFGSVGNGRLHAVVVVQHIAGPAVGGIGLVRGRLCSPDHLVVRSEAVQKDQGNQYRHQPRLERVRQRTHLWRREGTYWLWGSRSLDEEAIAVARVVKWKHR